jgi:hypothetical protein
MRILVDLPENQVKRIQQYLDKGIYTDLSGFLVAAIESQMELEKNAVFSKKVNLQTSLFSEKSVFVTDLSLNDSDYATISNKRFPTVPPPKWERLCIQKNISEEKTWTWGQINRIFPVKLAVRALLKLIVGRMAKQQSEETFSGKVPYDFYVDYACEVARAIGAEVEKREENERGEKVSAALPIGDDESKAKARFKNQFLITMRRDGTLDGALARFKFANLDEDGGALYVALTDAGYAFAKEENPVLDQSDTRAAFQEKEVAFLLSHVKNEVPGEYNAMSWLLTTISKGINKRPDINEALKAYTSKEKYHWSDSVINTQRSGLISRTAELDLITREKDGLEVTYGLSDSGKKVLRT